MVFSGYLQLAGNEVANNARTMTYVRHLLPKVNVLCDDCPDLHLSLGDEPYASPLVDGAPWVDPNNKDTWRFAGLLVTGMSGFGDSTRQVQVFPSTGEGGVVGRARRDVREMRVTGTILAADDCALDVGWEWLKKVLEGDQCRTPGQGCAGDELCFFSCCPPVEVGAVDPASPPVPHPVGLGVGWQTTGSWVNGVLSGPDGAYAVGVENEVPCDDVTLLWTFAPTEGAVVRVEAVNQDGGVAAASAPLRLRRVNWARNPTFRVGTAEWSPGADVALTADTDNERATAEVTQPVTADWTVATGDGATNLTGDAWSAGFTVELSPEGIVWDNLVPNPSARTLNGYSSSQQLTLDETMAHVGTRSARVTQTVDGLVNIGSITYGQSGTSKYHISAAPSTDYVAGVWVRPQVEASVTLTMRSANAAGQVLGTTIEPAVIVPAGAWTRLTGNFTSAPAATRTLLEVGAGVTTGTADGISFNVDALMVSPQAPLVDYFDGSFPNAVWLGAQHSSPSRLTIEPSPLSVSAAVNFDDGQTLGSPVVLAPGVPARVEVQGAVGDAGPVTVALVGRSDADTGTVLTFSRVLLERVPQAGDYFDGSFPSGAGVTHQWAGTPDASPSRRDITGTQIVAPSGNETLAPRITLIGGGSATVSDLALSYREAVTPEECAEQYLRRMRDVVVVDGPRIIRRLPGCAMAEIEFTLTAATPWVYHILPPVYQIPAPSPVTAPSTIIVFPGDPCPDEAPEPVHDPACPLPPSPPRPPAITSCLSIFPVTVYRRAAAKVSGDFAAEWQDAVPIIELATQDQAVRQARVRFYPNPLNISNLSDLDSCSYCGDFLITYIPAGSVLTVDAMVQRAWVETGAGQIQPATHLLRSSAGGPVEWPVLTCGTPYIITVDTSPTTATVATVDVRLAVRS